MKRILLLCFIHGFKGNDDTFQSFPYDLKKQVSEKLPNEDVESVVYPKYETKGELGQSAEALLAWLKERVMEVRKARTEKPWPPNDRDVGVVLVAHSMGGFVAADSLLLVLNERIAHGNDDSPIFPLIQGILTFDTPYNGLARSMFVYGAFSNYQKVSSVFNVMTALAAAPSGLGNMALKRSAAASISAPTRTSKNAWQGWQLIAVRTGTVGAIAAGGVAAYMHRKQIVEGAKSLRNLNKESVKEGYQNSIDALGQGLAYVNRGNVGKSFEYLSDHFTFVGSLMKQQELSRRLERMGALKGVGIHDFYTSLGENGVWTGGYFVPERTFCAIPNPEHQAYPLFTRQVIKETQDEVEAHISMFKRPKNVNYDKMTEEASNLVIRWFNDDSDIFDDLKFATPPPPEAIEEPTKTTEDGKEVPKTDEEVTKEIEAKAPGGDEEGSLPDESPLDIAAASSMVPLPADNYEAPETIDTESKNPEKTTYMRYLFGVAQQTGMEVRSYVPMQMPDLPQMPAGPSFKSFIPTQMPNLPSVNPFAKKQATQSMEIPEHSTETAEKDGEKEGQVEEAKRDEQAIQSTETLEHSSETAEKDGEKEGQVEEVKRDEQATSVYEDP